MQRERRGTARSNGAHWRGRLAAGTSTLGLTILLGMLVLAPSASAGSGGHTYLAPYKNSKATVTDPNSTTGGGSGVQIHPASWSKKTGVAEFSSSANTTWWTNKTNSSASEVGQVVLSIPIPVKTTGTHNVTAVWITMAAGYANLTAGSCSAGSSLYSGCTRSANVFVYGSAVLLDKNTSHSVASTNKWPGNHTYLSSYTNCLYSSCSTTTMGKPTGALHTGAAYWAFYFNGTALNATHKYVLKMTIFGGARVVLMTSGGAALSGASANAQFNSATLGNEEELYSVSVN